MYLYITTYHLQEVQNDVLTRHEHSKKSNKGGKHLN